MPPRFDTWCDDTPNGHILQFSYTLPIIENLAEITRTNLNIISTTTPYLREDLARQYEIVFDEFSHNILVCHGLSPDSTNISQNHEMFQINVFRHCFPIFITPSNVNHDSGD